jgi:hypothetical protein
MRCLFLCFLPPLAFAQSIAPPAGESVEPAKSTSLSAKPEKERIDWGSITRQSLFFTGIQHAFRIGTEPGTRDGLKGPFWRGYADSVGNLHGWADGDPFYVNYIGHPIQGAVSAQIFVQNDPTARLQRFGSGPQYFRSRMKAMAFAWAYSTWFEIGPMSEASIGKIQASRPQQGFVDHVVTPIIGTGWLLTEDFLDEKLILPFERRFQNKWGRIMMRSWLNPARSFTNALRFKSPWYRDTRGGITLAHYRAPIEIPPEPDRAFPLAAKFEFTSIPMWVHYRETQCAGGGGEAAWRPLPSLQLVGRLHGCQLRDLAPNRTGDTLTYEAGPRWTPLASSRLSPYVQLLVGGMKLTRYETDTARRALLIARANAAGQPPPREEEYRTQAIRHGLAFAAGSGVDMRLHPAVAIRLASVEYTRTFAGPLDGRNYNHGLQLSSGVILRFGTW